MDVHQSLLEWWPLLVPTGVGSLALYRTWKNGLRADRKDRTDLIKIAQEAAGAVIEDQQAHIDRLRAEIDEMRSELADVRKEHARMIADKEAKITLLEGELRQWKALATAYERLLAANNIPHAKPGQSVWEAKEAGLFLIQDDPNAGAGQ